MSEQTKDTIYIDIDDEITGIIEKLRGSKHKIVALVLPKRATVMQSVVNMKLLKRTADQAKKNVVLITSEASLLPLAGSVGVHVAKTLQSKPTIPAKPKLPGDNVDLDDVDDAAEEPETDAEADSEPEIDASTPVGELANLPAEETIDVDEEPEADKPGKKSKDKKGKKDKKLKIPNFDSFRKRLFLGGGIFVLLIIAWFFAYQVLPSAKITITTDNSSVDANVPFTASTAIKTFDATAANVPAISKDSKKVDTEKAAATGQKNVGEKASGTVSVRLSDCSQSQVLIPAGTGVSSNSLTFITQADISLSSVKIGNTCKNTDFPTFSSGSVKVVAQNAGDQYNLSGGRAYSVSGFANVVGTDSTAMTGGTNKTVTVISQSDIDGLKQKLADKSKGTALTELKKAFSDEGLQAIDETLSASPAAISSSPNVNDEASEVTVTSTVTFTLLGVKQDDLKTLVENAAKKQIDTSKQGISDNGLSKAVFKVTDKKSATEQKMTVETTVSTGTQINQDELKKQIAGKKRGEVQTIIQAYPGVKDVNVQYSPFWIYKTPKKTSKINLVFLQQK